MYRCMSGYYKWSEQWKNHSSYLVQDPGGVTYPSVAQDEVLPPGVGPTTSLGHPAWTGGPTETTVHGGSRAVPSLGVPTSKRASAQQVGELVMSTRSVALMSPTTRRSGDVVAVHYTATPSSPCRRQTLPWVLASARARERSERERSERDPKGQPRERSERKQGLRARPSGAFLYGPWTPPGRSRPPRQPPGEPPGPPRRRRARGRIY